MIDERELWACAHQVLRQHGDYTDSFIAQRVGELAKRGDESGVATWRAIASRVDQLRNTDGLTASRH